MNIGMLLDKEFYGDLRVENEVQALSAAGFKVYVYCFAFNGTFHEDDYHGASIINIPVSKKFIYKLRGLTNTVLNFYPSYLVRLIKKYITQHQIDALHIHDLYLFETGLKAKNLFKNIVLIGDLHENYVEGLKHYKFSNTFPGNVLISIKKWQASEVEWCNKFDYLITVIEEAVDRYKSLGIPENKFSVVPNYVNLDTFLTDEIDKSIVLRFKDNFSVMYVGGFDVHRGLEVAIKAVPFVVDKIENFKLVLVGKGRNFDDLVNLAKSLNIEKYISFEGWQPVAKLSSYIEASSVCLIPHLKTQHTDNTIPHKLFQYMVFEKPVIVSNCKPLERILNKENAGLIYNANNSEELAKSILTLYENPELRKEMGKRGKEAVISEYNWSNASKSLISLYQNIK
ncbi:GDP-mannose-dependent alpha-(1-2)-phosphatidylinositol mannosyltransferase [bacterium BMS3Abin04]|nr:GDP-mannose-dependent alpha-(1-2)-phosphatidylinositol mannosyltransferase [bacterium BMS3Abin04]